MLLLLLLTHLGFSECSDVDCLQPLATSTARAKARCGGLLTLLSTAAIRQGWLDSNLLKSRVLLWHEAIPAAALGS